MSQNVDRKFYTDPQFHASYVIPAYNVDFGTSTGAGTAANTLVPTTGLPSAIGRVRVKNVRMVTTVIPHASCSDLKVTFLNGANAFAVVTLTTSTAGQQLVGVITEANNVLADQVKVTASLTGTATASGVVLGDYDVLFEMEPAVG